MTADPKLKPDYTSVETPTARRWTISDGVDLWRYSSGQWSIVVSRDEHITEERGLKLARALELARDGEEKKQ